MHPAPTPDRRESPPPHDHSRPRKRRDRHLDRLLPRPRGPRRHRHRPPAGAGAGDELRQRRRGLAGLRIALGRSGRAGEGDQVAADEPQPADHQADDGRRDVALGLRDAAQLHRGALPRQQEPHGARGRIQPRLPEGAARRDGHRLRRPRPGHAAAVSHAKAARWRGQGHRDPRPVRRAVRSARHRKRPTCEYEPALRRRGEGTSSSARCACPATKPATASCSPSAWPRWPRRSAPSSVSASTSRAW